MNWYNPNRVHSSLGDVTPEQTCLEMLPKLGRAADQSARDVCAMPARAQVFASEYGITRGDSFVA